MAELLFQRVKVEGTDDSTAAARELWEKSHSGS
jgi:hypothetical protein